MIISFDLDDTLIPGTKRFETEKQSFIHQLFGIEKIRLGTIDLFKELRNKGYRIYIYTTSLRSKAKIKLTFYLYGIPVDMVINQQIHDQKLKGYSIRTSKFPPAFDIDIHVDDSPGLKIEGDKYNFNTIIIEETDTKWRQTILERL